jgi:hypothetical protein
MAGYFGNVVPPPYQGQTTPYPQGAAYGVGAGANTLVSNLIAAALYQKQQEEDARRQALVGFEVVGRHMPGALRQPGAQGLTQQAGLGGIDFQGMPPTKEEMGVKATQELWRRYPQYVGMPASVIVEMLKEEALMNRLREGSRLFGQFGGQGGAPAPQSAAQGMPPTPEGEAMDRTGYADYAPPPSAAAPARPAGPQPLREFGMKMGPQGLEQSMSVKDVPPTPQQLNQPQVAEAMKAARRQILQDAQSGKQITAPDGTTTTFAGLAKIYNVTPSDLVDARAATMVRSQGYELPAGTPTMETIHTQYTKARELVQKQATDKAELARLEVAQKNAETMLKNSNEMMRRGEESAARGMRLEGQTIAKEVLSAARFMYEENEKAIANEGGESSKTPAMPALLEKRRTLAANIERAIFTLQSQAPAVDTPTASGSGGAPPRKTTPRYGPPSTPMQSPVGSGRAGYPSQWFKPGSQTPIVEGSD